MVAGEGDGLVAVTKQQRDRIKKVNMMVQCSVVRCDIGHCDTVLQVVAHLSLYIGLIGYTAIGAKVELVTGHFTM